jgi:hypothetical protein
MTRGESKLAREKVMCWERRHLAGRSLHPAANLTAFGKDAERGMLEACAPLSAPSWTL